MDSQQMRVLWIIFLAMIGGCLMFGGVSLVAAPAPSPDQPVQAFLIVGSTLALSGIFGVYHFTLRKTDNPVQWKLFHLLGYALAEGGTLANLVFFFITRDTTFFFIAIAVLIAMATRYPRPMHKSSQGDGQDLRSPASFESRKD